MADVQTLPEPTLGTALRSLASAQLPGRFYQGLQLAAPAAVQFWIWGWHRSAGCMVAVSAFGVWALCQQALERREEWARLAGDDSAAGSGTTRGGLALRIARRSAGLVAALIAFGLVAEGFVEVMAYVFRCPGCAG